MVWDEKASVEPVQSRQCQKWAWSCDFCPTVPALALAQLWPEELDLYDSHPFLVILSLRNAEA